MAENAETIERFYRAFQQRDADGMAACYAPDVVFSDPAFSLEGWRASAMWRMLCERGADLKIEFSDVQVEGDAGSARWEARYTFSATGQKVHNIIEARFRFRDGLIVEHRDSFSFYRWASQALGLKGKLLGWLPPVQKAVQKQAARGLEAFIKKRGLGPNPSS